MPGAQYAPSIIKLEMQPSPAQPRFCEYPLRKLRHCATFHIRIYLPRCCIYYLLSTYLPPTSALYLPIYYLHINPTPYLCAVHTPTSMLYIPLPLCCTYPYLSAVGHVEVVVGPVQLRHVVLRPGRRGAQSSPAT